MDKSNAIEALHALAQDTRLATFRLLVKHGAEGMAAGDIADALGVKQNTMSANLAVLARAGMVRSAREGRVIRYFADFDGMRSLLAFLMEDCCGGNPDLCKPVLDEVICAC
ncbi:metalloregulator ArsR/SmtB family transcription factor [Oricola sp.]|uniref:ArsR/SmtB family transcription factor n=1 Tax=Oricola sp. TaxID=1979950 RepID=UPI0025F79735|nr:metalloregulator ArsR/SmtB family transcription factor [Oricola sp.]MCI5077402.1 metalloregulator ArsR/SmtB family transcription factor [Oricola sp.]